MHTYSVPCPSPQLDLAAYSYLWCVRWQRDGMLTSPSLPYSTPRSSPHSHGTTSQNSLPFHSVPCPSPSWTWRRRRETWRRTRGAARTNQPCPKALLQIRTLYLTNDNPNHRLIHNLEKDQSSSTPSMARASTCEANLMTGREGGGGGSLSTR